MSYRAWTHTKANQVIAASGIVLTTNRNLFLALITSLIAAPGCTVVGSSNSVTAGMDGVNRIALGGDIVWGNPGAVHTWIVLAFAGQGGTQICLSFEGASATGVLTVSMFSPGALFTGGSITARPTATDELSFSSSTTTALGVDGSYALHVLFNSDGSQIHVVCFRTGVTNSIWMWTQGILRDPPAAFPTLRYCGWNVATGGGAGAWALWGNAAFLKWRNGVISATAFVTAESWGSTGTPAQSTGPSSFSGRTQMFPVGFVSRTGSSLGRHGTISDLHFIDAGLASGDVAVLASGERFAVIDDFAIPWNGSVPFISASAPVETLRPSELVGLAAGGGGLRSASAAGALDVDPDVARWTPVLLEFDVPPLHEVTLITLQGLDSALWMVAYEDALGGLAPLFEDKSILTVEGTVATGRRFGISLLPNGGWQRDQVTVVPKIGREVT